MKLKILKKLFFTTSAVFFVTLTLVFLLLSLAVNDVQARNSRKLLNNVCEETISTLSEYEQTQAFSTISALSRVNNTQIFIIDDKGRVTFCNCDDFSDNLYCVHTSTIISKKFISSVNSQGVFELSSIDGLLDKMSYVYAQKSTSETPFYVLTASSVMSASEILKLLLGLYVAAAILPLLFMFVVEYGIVYRLFRPLKYMSEAAKSIAKGDFSKRVPVMSNDEIGELSVLFNRMTDSLSRTERTGKSFVANISHELRTPMTTISGFIDGILDGTIDENRREHYLKIVSDEVKRMARLVQSMLSLTRLEFDENPLNLSEFRFSDIVTNVVVSMEQKISDKNIDIVGIDTLSQTMLYGDLDLLHQVVYNLVDNAVKFTHYGGKIEFQLHRIEENLEFKIKNSGDGIPQPDLPHILEKFYKIDKSRSAHKESLGLGLYICKTIIELHSGLITVKSDSESYTEFKIRLPIKK